MKFLRQLFQLLVVSSSLFATNSVVGQCTMIPTPNISVCSNVLINTIQFSSNPQGGT
jgi:hypothetical protein